MDLELLHGRYGRSMGRNTHLTAMSGIPKGRICKYGQGKRTRSHDVNDGNIALFDSDSGLGDTCTLAYPLARLQRM